MQIILLGMHRSGTSLVTRLINMLGVYFGPEGISTGANEENPKGFWERRDVRALNDKILNSMEAEWDRVSSFDAKKWASHPPFDFDKEMRKILLELNAHRPWVMKEPRLCLTFPLWRPFLELPLCVFSHRHPLEIAVSLQKRNGFSLPFGIALWETYVRHALQASAGIPRVLVRHADLLQDPVATVGQLHRWLSDHGVRGLTLPTSSEICSFVSANLYRARIGSHSCADLMTPAQIELMQTLDRGYLDEWTNPGNLSGAARSHLLAHEELHLHRTEVAELKRTASLLSEQKNTWSLSTKQATDKCNDLQNQLTSLQQELEQVRHRQAAREQRLGVLEQNVAEQSARLAKLDGENRRLECERDILASQRERDREEQRASQSMALHLTAENARLTLFQEQNTARLQTLEKQRYEDEERIKELEKTKSKIQTLAQEKKSLLSDLERAQRSQRNLQGELNFIKQSRMWKVGTWVHRLRNLALLKRPFGRAKTHPLAQREAMNTPADKPTAKETRQNQKPHAKGPQTFASKPKISVIAWDMAHNPLGRAYLLADVLREKYHVELVGPLFPRYGTQIWEPLRKDSRVPIRTFPGRDFPGFLEDLRQFASSLQGDAVIVSKPRLPSLALGLLASLDRHIPMLLDIDDYELGFFPQRDPLTLEQLAQLHLAKDLACPHDNVWTRLAESLISSLGPITVSNAALQEKYGGVILPHIRDERLFDPGRFDRQALRQRHGIEPEDKVILFAGTPRRHKGFMSVIEALKRIGNPNYRMVMVGTPVDGETLSYLEKQAPRLVKIIPNQSFFQLPEFLMLADLVCILQDPESVVSQFQMPAKFTDALAMGIPTLVNAVSPFSPLVSRGLVESVGNEPLDGKIEDIFCNLEQFRVKAGKNREIFLQEYSYKAGLGILAPLVDKALATTRKPPAPQALRSLRFLFDSYGNLDSRKWFSSRQQSTPVPIPAGQAAQCEKFLLRERFSFQKRQRKLADDRFNVVFFWKQNDSGLYGRRQDMMVKYLARNPKVHQIYHFDAPLTLAQWASFLKDGLKQRYTQSRLMFQQTLRRKLGLANQPGVRFDTYLHGSILKNPAPEELLKAYGDYLARTLEHHRVWDRHTIFWVCPRNFEFPEIARRLRPDLILSDVIDDHTKWPCAPAYREKLMQNYQDILSMSDLVIANCQSVKTTMSAFHGEITVLPNACELFNQEVPRWKVPGPLRSLRGPIIGYVGNLDINRLDLELLNYLVTSRPEWNFILIGSMHQNQDILQLSKHKNVKFLGVVPYEKALHYIKAFDVAIIPHLDNELTRNMNPLKLYVFCALGTPVVTTEIDNIQDFRGVIKIGTNHKQFLEQLDSAVEKGKANYPSASSALLAHQHSWPHRVEAILELVKRKLHPVETSMPAVLGNDETARVDRDAQTSGTGYSETCTICGFFGALKRDRTSIRESYPCQKCGATLRYREQAALILKTFAEMGATTLQELAWNPAFRRLKIYEPGISGPFRPILEKLPGYVQSYFWEGVELGTPFRGVQCQDLMNLTFPDGSFDLILSSDILEHVRRPMRAFEEIQRTLRPDGLHIFSLPVPYPLPRETVYRVDTSGEEDIHLCLPHYHGAPVVGRSLVYTDFGSDLVDELAKRGILLEIHQKNSPFSDLRGMLTFLQRRAPNLAKHNSVSCHSS